MGNWRGGILTAGEARAKADLSAVAAAEADLSTVALAKAEAPEGRQIMATPLRVHLARTTAPTPLPPSHALRAHGRGEFLLADYTQITWGGQAGENPAT